MAEEVENLEVCLILCASVWQIVSKGSMDTTLFDATAAATQPYITITHLHAKQELIHGTANDPRTAERRC